MSDEEQQTISTTEEDPKDTQQTETINTPEDPTEELHRQIAALQDQYLRQAAEFDNYRKRVLREKADLIKTGGERVITAILPVLDDLERAAQTTTQTADATQQQALQDGVRLIAEKLLSTLQREGLQKIDALGQPFDTDLHEAVALLPTDDPQQKGKVVQQVQAGYKLADKVIRHAKVAVAQ